MLFHQSWAATTSSGWILSFATVGCVGAPRLKDSQVDIASWLTHDIPDQVTIVCESRYMFLRLFHSARFFVFIHKNIYAETRFCSGWRAGKQTHAMSAQMHGERNANGNSICWWCNTWVFVFRCLFAASRLFQILLWVSGQEQLNMERLFSLSDKSIEQVCCIQFRLFSCVKTVSLRGRLFSFNEIIQTSSGTVIAFCWCKTKSVNVGTCLVT